MGGSLAVDPRTSLCRSPILTDVSQCSHDENFAYLNRKDGNPAAIKLLNPATQEFQIVRTSLIPGLLKTLRENKALALPLRIFECSDIAVQDAREERMCRNYRHLGAAYTDKKGGFEVVHGLLDRVMQMLEVPFIGSLSADAFAKATHGYYIREAQGESSLSVLDSANPVPDEMYFPGRAATIHYRPRASTNQATENQGSVFETVAKALKDALPTSSETSSTTGDMIIGSLGILHPTVLDNFSLVNPCSVLEINVEPFL
jgi:phenylalanyl-tRNA synthetase beta chain